MRNTTLVYKGLLCALLGGLLAGEITTGAPLVPSEALALGTGSYDGRPTVGGEPAFATRSDAMLSTVQSLIKAEDYGKAAEAAAELTKAYPDHRKGWLLLGYCRSLISDYDGSNEAYDKALSLGADSRTVQMRKAYNYIKKTDFASARRCYESILETNFTDHEVLKLLAVMEGKLGNLDKSAFYYRRALEFDPESVDALLALAKIAEKQGRPAEVRAMLEKALEVEPDNTKILGRLALSYMKADDHKAAIVCLDKLVAAEPENVKAYRNLAVAHYELENKASARDAFEKVRELGGDMHDLYAPLADCYLASGSRATALEVVREGLENGNNRAWLYCIWGKILEDSRNFDAAISKFQLAVELNEEPWRGYAQKEIARQIKLKKRAEMIAEQKGMQ